MNGQMGRVLLAGALIAIAILLLLANLNVLALDIGDFMGTWWPAILIFIGAWQVASQRGRSLGGPVFLIALGAVLQVITLGWAGWGILWPVALIAAGLVVLLQGSRFRQRPSQEATGDDTIALSAMFSGVEHRITSANFRGGRVTATFGGIEMDLRDARLQQDATLEVTALFGGVELKVPDEWNVQVHGAPLFGGIEDAGSKRASQGQQPGPVLHIETSITFGGLEIKR